MNLPLHRLKCNRESPCTSCWKRSDTVSCVYSSEHREARESLLGSNAGPQASEAKVRLQKLEEMVTTLMQTAKPSWEGNIGMKSLSNRTVEEPNTAPSQSSPQSSESTSLSHSILQHSGSEYHGATHWTAILDDVCSTAFRSRIALMRL